MSPVPFLSSPMGLGPLQLRTRNFMASLTRNRSVPANVPNDANVLWYTQRTQGKSGLIFAEAALISPQGTEWARAPGIWSDAHVAGWTKVVDAVHAHEGFIFCQLWHLGRVAHPDMPLHIASGKPVYGPSAIAARGGKFRDLPGSPGYVQPIALEDPQTIIAEYRRAAENAKKAGFDGVDLGNANGYLPNQFLDSTANKRTDKWGGSVENRIRFTLEVVRAMVDVYGADRVGIKLSPGYGYNDMGMPLEETIETYSTLIKELVGMKLAYIQLLRSTPPDKPDPKHPTPGAPHDVLEAYGPLIKGSSTLLVLNGGLGAEEADGLIRDGKIDAASFGRAWINNPDFQKRLEAGIPLATYMDVHRFYNFVEDLAVGYTDYPTAT